MRRNNTARRHRGRKKALVPFCFPREVITSHAYDRYRQRYDRFLTFEECVQLRDEAQRASVSPFRYAGRVVCVVSFKGRDVPVVLCSDEKIVITVLPPDAVHRFV